MPTQIKHITKEKDQHLLASTPELKRLSYKDLTILRYGMYGEFDIFLNETRVGNAIISDLYGEKLDDLVIFFTFFNLEDTSVMERINTRTMFINYAKSLFAERIKEIRRYQ